jgi:type I restriction enzyme, S subunit
MSARSYLIGFPPGWTTCAIDDLGEVVTGKTPSTKTPSYWNGAIPFYRPPDVVRGQPMLEGASALTEAGAATVRVLPVGSVAVTCIGVLGRTGLVRVPGVTNQQINSVIVDSHLATPEYVSYVIQTPAVQGDMSSRASATTVPILNKSKFAATRVPLAPLNEQRRIVAKLDELFSKLDAGVEALKRTQELLKRYRQSVLKAAVQGDLTREWREAHPDVEPASVLLERIREERGKQQVGRRRKKEPPPLDTSDLPELPSGWAWTRFEEVFLSLKNGYFRDDRLRTRRALPFSV